MNSDDPVTAGANPLEQGLILGEGTAGALAEAPIVSHETRSGDLLLATTHHGLGYKSANEDRVVLIETVDRDGFRSSLFVVDGMGGRQRGDLSAQVLSEELVRTARMRTDEASAAANRVLIRRIESELDRLPTPILASEVRAMVGSAAAVEHGALTPKDLLWSAIEAVQVESIQIEEATPDNLRRIAEVLRALSDLSAPDTIEIALQRTRARIREMNFGSQPPDACFTGGIVHTDSNGSKVLDVKQIGDCKLVVSGSDNKVRFQTLGESMIQEPDLCRPDVPLAELMTYSLHRNIVTNSVNSPKMKLKKYRRSDVPMDLQRGDRVFIYSDGVDDLFCPQELIRMLEGQEPEVFVRQLLQASERRMRYVSELLKAEQDKLASGEHIHAYPIVHRAMNGCRSEKGYYLEQYSDGSEARWSKPPKCDNTSFCMLVVR
jgi:serine/threonine protein phosphatase PrpC